QTCALPIYLPHALRVELELRPAALARRGRPWQALAARPHAGRRLAAPREPARALRNDVDAAGQEAALHGRRVRPVVGVEPRRAARVAPARAREPPRHPALGARPERALRARARAPRARLRAVGLRVDRLRRRRAEHARVAAARRDDERRDRGGRELDAAAAPRLPARRAARRLLARAPEQRLRALRRQRS